MLPQAAGPSQARGAQIATGGPFLEETVSFPNKSEPFTQIRQNHPKWGKKVTVMPRQQQFKLF